MSILIKGIQMPTCCEECAFVRTVGLDRWKCELSGCDFNSWDVGWGDGTENKYIRHSSCPLVEVSPHGRLIDADAFIAEQRHLYCENCERRKGMKNGKVKFVYDIGDAPCRACGYGDVLDDLEDAPTVIEEEEGDT